jgi:tripartite-type tricarboxylate transporter receptor subunit TctC
MIAIARVAAAVAIATAAAVNPAWSQADLAAGFPSKPIRIVAGVAPGGGIDIAARLVAEKLSERLGQPVVIENKTGVGGRLAAEYVAKAPADGYTLLAGSTSQMSVSPAIYPNLSFSPQRDFMPVSMVMSTAFLLVVPPSHPAKTVQDLVAWAKANPDKANYATSTTTTTLAAELLKIKTGMPGVTVPYKASSESVVSVMSGQTTFAIADAVASTQAAKSGLVRAIAVTSASRLAELPDVPTLAEAGVEGMVVTGWVAIFAPAGTPAPIVERLERAIAWYAQLPDVRERLAVLSSVPIANSPADLASLIAAETKLYSEVVKAANLKFDN